MNKKKIIKKFFLAHIDYLQRNKKGTNTTIDLQNTIQSLGLQ